MKRILIALLIVSLTHTLAFSQKYQRPQVQTPGVYRADQTQPTHQSFGDEKWFDVFKDDKLQQLIRDALAYNYDVREAVARIDAARANLGIVRADQYPNIGASADVTTERRSR